SRPESPPSRAERASSVHPRLRRRANELATGCALHDDPANGWQIQPQYPGAPGAVRSTIYVPASRKFPTYDTGYQAPVATVGRLESRRYTSPLSTNPVGVHDIVVYLPHGYDPNRATPYPTLYLSHGSGDHSTAWTMQGVAHLILENAIKDRAAQPMVIVSTDFNGLPGGNEGYVNDCGPTFSRSSRRTTTSPPGRRTARSPASPQVAAGRTPSCTTTPTCSATTRPGARAAPQPPRRRSTA
ncbi:hypothetical protein PSH25_005578, partial [Micromonospora sp. PSH25]|nr:hypothetical protein [Micromonospora foliorum]